VPYNKFQGLLTSAATGSESSSRLKFVSVAGKLPFVTHIAQARNVFDIELAALKAVRAQLDSNFDSAVETLIQSLNGRGKTVVVGIGKSGNVGTKIAATLTSTGSTAVVLNSVDALHGDLGIVNDGDVILALSYSGESEELLNLLPALKRFLVKIISFTGNPKSSLASHSDVVLNVRVTCAYRRKRARLISRPRAAPRRCS
jgi:arabinose-5-phosphate isomerase